MTVAFSSIFSSARHASRHAGAAGSLLQAGGENPTAAHMSDHFSRTILDVWTLRGPAVGTSPH